jgi:hypothetical protein
MGSVMYTPNPSNRGSSNYSSSRSSAESKTRSIRAIAGLWSFGFICYGAYFSYQIVALMAGGLSGVGTAVTLVASGGTMLLWVLRIFDTAQGRGVRAITYICLTCTIISGFVPGFAGLFAVVCIGAGIVGGAAVVLYLIVAKVSEFLIGNKMIAVAVASLPLIGAIFYVPSALSDAGLNVSFSQTAPAIGPSPIAAQLSGIDQAVKQSYAGAAVLAYGIRNNRLYADISRNGAIESIELETRSLVQTPIPWLQWNLSKRLDRLTAAGGTTAAQLTTILSPVANALKGFDTVMFADGALLNYSQQAVLPDKRVFRSVSLDQQQIAQNIQKWAAPVTLSAGDVSIINAVPSSMDELEKLDIAGGQWSSWTGIHTQFQESIPRGVSSTAATKALALDALQNKKGVLFVVAHSDGFSIRLPNGESVGVKDFDSIQDAIRRNHPRVFLFSCETARVENMQSFAKTLLDHGAEAVVAPTTQISTTEALRVFKSFLSSALGSSPMSVSEAFQKAQQDSNGTSMEVWVGSLFLPAWLPEHGVRPSSEHA